MKLFMALFLAGTLASGAEHWEFVGQQDKLAFWLNTEIRLMTLEGGSVVQVQNKIAFPRGETVVTTRFWRRQGPGWQAATKLTDSFDAKGALRSHQEVLDSKLVWVPTEVPEARAWIALLERAEALLKAAGPPVQP